jgi:hypothetical protein
MSSSAGVQACVWRDSCAKEGCSRCVLNRERINNLRILEDRAFGEEYWELCPQLASLVHLTLPRAQPYINATVNATATGRRLLEVLSLRDTLDIFHIRV